MTQQRRRRSGGGSVQDGYREPWQQDPRQDAEASERIPAGKDAKARARARAQTRVLFAIIGSASILTLVFLLCLAMGYNPFRSVNIAGTGLAGSVEDTGYEGLRISELMAANGSAVPDEQGNFPDWLEVWNSSSSPINLLNVGLSNRPDAIRFLFPDITLEPDERIVVWCDNTNANTAGKPLHAKFKLSSIGKTVYLFTPRGYEIDEVSYGILSSDASYALLPDGTWQEVNYFSPGEENTPEGNARYYTASTANGGELVINEIMASARSGLADEDGEFVDWIELYNTTDHTIELDNYGLSDKEKDPLKWRFPDGALIQPHQYYIVFCSGKDRRTGIAEHPHANFSISAEHDTVLLSNTKGQVLDRVVVDNLPRDCSWARDDNGTFSVHVYPTPGRNNNDTAGADLDLRSRNTWNIFITEVMSSNSSVIAAGNEDCPDWVELYNAGATDMNISGCGLSDNVNRPRRWQFPEGTWIRAGERMIVFCDGTALYGNGTGYHTNFKLSKAGEETVCFSDPQGRVLDRLILPAIPNNVSYGRTLGSTGFFYYDAPSPGAENLGGFLGYSATPAVSLAPGLYDTAVTLHIDVPAGTTVFYTTDGSIPTRSATAYHGEDLSFLYTTVLRVRAYDDNPLIYPSSVVTGTYFVAAYHSLPIFSVVCDPEELWNPTDGLLTVGDNVVKEAGKLPFKNTVYRAFGKVPRACHVEYYQLDGTQVLNQDCQMALMGDFSLDMPQKSMKFRAKAVYGAKTFAAPLFEDRPYTEYKSFVLRNSGNDMMWTRLQDGFQSRLLDAYEQHVREETGDEDYKVVVHLAWKPVVVYLNGVYWGHMNLRERADRFLVAQYEGISLDEADSMVILEASGALKHGTRAQLNEFKAMKNKIKAGNPASNPSDLQYILDNVDVDNLFEYMALEMFVGNSDIGNTRYYRLPGEGNKWRWLWYDVDYGLWSSSFNSPKSYTKAKGMGEKNIDNTIFMKLLSVPEYKDKFLRKLGDVYQFLTTEKMLEVLEPLVEQIRPEMQAHSARWGPYFDEYVISDVKRYKSEDGAYRYWEERLDRLRNVVRKRPNLLWGYIRDAFSLSQSQMEEYFGPQPAMPPEAY